MQQASNCQPRASKDVSIMLQDERRSHHGGDYTGD
jgi:hypothetical protein